MKFSLRESYSAEAITSRLGGGSPQSYLPQKNGIVLCGLFNCNINSRAPKEIDVGSGPRVQQGAELLSEGRYPIPIFLKQRSRVWEYVGDYVCIRYSKEPQDLYPLNPDRRADAIGVLFLERVFSDLDSEAPAQYFAQEGGLSLRLHYIRERDPSLSRAKKRVFRVDYFANAAVLVHTLCRRIYPNLVSRSITLNRYLSERKFL
jgi:hypothetical protein